MCAEEIPKQVEQTPTGGDFPVPEDKSKSKGFRIIVENPEDIYNETLKRGVSGNLGKFLLTGLGGQVTIDINAGEGNFDVSADVRVDNTYRKTELINLIKEGIVASHNPGILKVEGGGDSITITTTTGIKFVIGETSAVFNQITISTGVMSSKYTKEVIRAFDPPSSDKETFYKVMAGFTEVFQAVVKEIYKVYNTDSPNAKWVIRSPNKDAISLGVKSKELTQAEELLMRTLVENPNVSFEDIGGLDEAVEQMKLVVAAIENPESFTRWGTKPPKGVLLIGPPGTGKTLLAEALATEAKTVFLHVRASDFVSKWYGESEKNLAAIFNLTRSIQGKVIIFFDEIDGIFSNREGAHEVTQRLVSLFLDWFGIPSLDNVIVVAATNRPEAIDPALRRPGRFDREIIVPLPNEEGRRTIFEIHMKNAEELAGRELFNKLLFNIDNLDEIVRKTEGFSGADIAEIIRRVLEGKVKQEIRGLQPGEVTKEDIIREIERFKRRTEQKRPIGFRTDFYEKPKND